MAKRGLVESIKCIGCEVSFVPTNWHHKYCTNECYIGSLDYVTRRLKVKNLTIDQYDEMWIEQIGLCPICYKTLPNDYSSAIDHNHTTGKIRGLLHSNCNSALGMLDDRSFNALQAAVYLLADNA